MTAPAARIAIAGLGPKGTYALERLLAHAALVPERPSLEIVCFEPHPVPGAGPVYDPGQPDWLRMNFTAEMVDMWVDVDPADRGRRPDFAGWRAARDPGAGRARDARYPPRAQVGSYLAEGLGSMLAELPAGVTVEIRPERVTGAKPLAGGWELELEPAAARAADRPDRFDELLITVGHQPAGAVGLAADYAHAAPLVEAVFPVERRLGTDRVPAGASVATRGFALTFLDAALALTEGRGGRFEPVAGGGRRFHYEPGEAGAGVLRPFTRTGRPMLAKPDPEIAAGAAGLDDALADCRQRVLALPAGFDIGAELVPIIATGAAEALERIGGGATGAESRAIAAAIEALVTDAGAGLPSPAVVVERIEASIDIGAGRRPPNRDWALGECWRGIYPAVAARLGDGGISARSWPRFQKLAAELERIAFGPPPLNAAKLLALIEAGRINLGALAGGRLESRGGSTWLVGPAGPAAEIDVVIDAVLPPPGARDVDSPLLATLLAGGAARVAASRRGLEVCPDGRTITGSGAVSSGLAVLGRPTEDWIVGNDTLSRSLHPHPNRWARGVLRRLARGAAEAAPVA